MDWKPGAYAIVAARVSTNETLQKSRTEQFSIGRRIGQRLGLPIPDDGYYYDELSRDDWPRPDLQRAFERMSDPLCVALLVWNTDRIYADPVQQLETFEVLEEHQVQLHDEYEWKNRPGDLDEALAAIESIMARLEVRKTRRRVYTTHRAKAQDGIFISRPPYGIRATDTRRVWEIVPEQQQNLLQMYEWAAAGITLSEICRRLERLGIVSPVREIKSGERAGQTIGGQPWSKSNLRKMLLNRFYRGEFVWNRNQTVRRRATSTRKSYKGRAMRPESDWIVRQHALGPIVPVELWDAAQAQIVARHKTRDDTRRYPPMLFDGLVQCGRCGWKMYPRKRANLRADGTRSELFDYACSGVYNPYSSCTVDHKIPETWLLGLLAGTSKGPVARVQVTYQEDAGTDVVTPELEAIGRREVELGGELAQLEKLALAEFFTVEQAVAKKQELEAARAALVARRQELLAAPKEKPLTEDAPLALQNIVPLLHNERIAIEERRLSLSRLLVRVVVDRPGVRFVLREQAPQA